MPYSYFQYLRGRISRRSKIPQISTADYNFTSQKTNWFMNKSFGVARAVQVEGNVKDLISIYLNADESLFK